jgi:hypothetical protein
METQQGKPLQLMPAAPGTCQECAQKHAPDEAHDATSLHYAFWFLQKHGRSHTWEDAIAHCSEERKQIWREHIRGYGVDPSSTKVRP